MREKRWFVQLKIQPKDIWFQIYKQYNNIKYYFAEHLKPRKLPADARLPSIVI